jgi:hypothetical protein
MTMIKHRMNTIIRYCLETFKHEEKSLSQTEWINRVETKHPLLNYKRQSIKNVMGQFVFGRKASSFINEYAFLSRYDRKTKTYFR